VATMVAPKLVEGEDLVDEPSEDKSANGMHRYD
jgi:hypothetical protein